MTKNDVAELIAAAQFLLERRDTEANYYGRVLAEIAKRELDAAAAARKPVAYVRADELEKLADNRIAGRGMMLNKEPGAGLVALYREASTDISNGR